MERAKKFEKLAAISSSAAAEIAYIATCLSFFFDAYFEYGVDLTAIGTCWNCKGKDGDSFSQIFYFIYGNKVISCLMLLALILKLHSWAEVKTTITITIVKQTMYKSYLKV